MRKNHKLIAAAAALAALGAGGSAFTASLTTTAQAKEVVAGGNVATSGATLNAIRYVTTYDATADVDEVTSVVVTLAGVYVTADTVVTLHIDDIAFTCGDETAGASTTEVTCTHAGLSVVGMGTTHVAVMGTLA